MIFNSNLPLLFALFFMMAFLKAWIIYAWNSPELKQFHDIYDGVQKIHEGNTPRLGGFIFYITLFLIAFLVNFQGSDLLKLIVLCLIPTVFVTFIEDLFNNIQPKARLYSLLLSSSLLFFISDISNPIINIPLLMDFFQQHHLILSFLLIVSLSGLANGFNLIDGANGLLYFSFLSILATLLSIATAIGSEPFINIYVLLITLTSISVVFNYPLGKIFAGDLGAYSLGLLVGFSTIALFSENPTLITWYALLILFYPVCELIFTMIRRFVARKPMMKADKLHLHQMIYEILNQKLTNNFANNLVAIVLIPIWIFPLIWFTLFGPLIDFFMTWVGILLELSIYLVSYVVTKTYFETKIK